MNQEPVIEVRDPWGHSHRGASGRRSRDASQHTPQPAAAHTAYDHAAHHTAAEPQPSGFREGSRLKGFGARKITFLAVGVIAALILFAVPMPYVVDSPGPTFDISGYYGDAAIIDIEGTDPATGEALDVEPAHKSLDGAGQLRMVTVSESGGPGRRLNLVQLIEAYFDSQSEIIPYEDVYPEEVTQAEADDAQLTMMLSSQASAQSAALTHLGWRVPAVATIRGTTDNSNAYGKVEDGDILTSVTTPDGTTHPVDTASAVFDLLKTIPVGTVLSVNVERGSDPLSFDVETIAGEEGTEGSKLGIYLDIDAQLPLDITFNFEDIGGPSAGIVFALAIIDRLTPGDLMGGESIAGTGTMSYSGEVGPIGGIVQKMHGAQRDGANYFLAPTSNCDEVIGNEPDDLHVVAVSTLDEALAAVDAIAAGQGDTLPTCWAVFD